MFDWVPILLYNNLYYYVILFFVVITFAHTVSNPLGSSENKKFSQSILVFLFLFVLLYMGTRPISWVFGDMGTYNRIFNNFANGAKVETKGDIFFKKFTQYCSQIMNARTFFFVCGVLYVVPLWLAAKKWFKGFAFYAFLLLVASFSFWPYGTNGIRNGIATSLVLFGMSRDLWVWRIVLFYLAFGFHSSVIVPIAGYVLAFFYTKPQYFLYGWLACIPLSLIAGGSFQALFAGLFEDDRVGYLTDGNVNNDNFSSIGFRWDFVLYSASAVYAGWWFIFKKGYEYRFYQVIYCTYLAANGFWILVIKANFSNRFAYLSWFMMAVVIVYPIVKHKFVPKQNQLLAYIVLAYFGFTFFMQFIFYGK